MIEVSRRSLATVGESMVLLAAPRIGRLRQQSSLQLRVGGAESNVAIGVRRLGTPATWIGRLGRDEFGALIAETLRAEHVVVEASDDPGPTSLMVKERRSADVTNVLYYRGLGPGSRLCPDDLPAEAVRAAGVLHLTGVTPALSRSALATCERAIRLARASGTVVAFDVNYRQALWSPGQARPVLRSMLQRADIVFAGRDEAELLGASGSREQQARGLAALGPRIAVVKAGADGATALVDGELVDVPPQPAVPVDPVGAGDAFAAGFLADLLQGRGAEAALDTAAWCGAHVAASEGDWEGLPHRAELTRPLPEGQRVST